MSNKTSTNLLFLAIGAAVGTAVGYVIACDKKEEWVKEINNLVGKVRLNVMDAMHKGKNKVEEVKNEYEQ